MSIFSRFLPHKYPHRVWFQLRSFAKKDEPKKEDKVEAKKEDKAEAKPEKKDKKPRMKTFRIWRYNPQDTKKTKPFMQTYQVDLNNCRPMILDALNLIKTEQDTTLSYRRSCREGICGSCGMNIDGVNRLACLHKISPGGTTRIYPLPHMYVIRDLVVDMNQFLNQHRKIKPFLIDDSVDEGRAQLLQSMKDRDKLDGHIECILCACCSTSCPEYWWHGHGKPPNDFLGPAALLNAYRWMVDSRDKGSAERLADLKNYYSVYRCHQINNCTNCCPKKLNPSRAIAKLRLLLALTKKPKPEMSGTLESDPMKACNDTGDSDDPCKDQK